MDITDLKQLVTVQADLNFQTNGKAGQYPALPDQHPVIIHMKDPQE